MTPVPNGPASQRPSAPPHSAGALSATRRRTSRVIRNRGFTILEAIIALAMLAAVFGVCLGLRAQSLAADRRAAAILESERDVDALFQMVINRSILDFEIDPQTLQPIWTGTHLGRAYRIERDIIVVDNPVRGQVPHESDEQIGVFEYRIAYNGRTTKVVWHR